MVRFKDILSFPLLSQQRRLAASRPAMSESEFTEQVSGSELGRRAAELLWHKLLECRVEPTYTPYPDDDLHRCFGLAEEDLDEDVLLAIMNELGVPKPDQSLVDSLGPVRTSRDAIALIEAAHAAA